MPVTKSVKQHIHGWWPFQQGSRAGRRIITGQLLKQVVEDLEGAGVPLDVELRIEHQSGYEATGIRLIQENLIQ